MRYKRMTREEAKGSLIAIKNKYLANYGEDSIISILIDEYDIQAIDMAIQVLEQTQWIPIEWKPFGKCGYPKPEDEYKYFLTIDDKGEITIQEFLLSLDEKSQPYFTGMRNIIAWMPLPKSYKEVEK